VLPALLKNTRDELNVHFLEIHTLKKNGVRQAMPGGLPGYHNTVLQVQPIKRTETAYHRISFIWCLNGLKTVYANSG
jgi:hypothetical protein